jgi:hypothetical protein
VFKLLLNTQPNSSGGFAPEGGASRSSFSKLFVLDLEAD